MNDADDTYSDFDSNLPPTDEDTAIFEHLQAMAEYIERNTKCRSIQIHVTKDREEGSCGRYSVGRGNIYERIGSCSEWLNTV